MFDNFPSDNVQVWAQTPFYSLNEILKKNVSASISLYSWLIAGFKL